MKSKSLSRFSSAAFSVLILTILLSSCAHKAQIVHVGPPHERYDHNRTCPMESPAVLDGKPFRLIEEAFSPYGAGVFPAVDYASGGTPQDGVPTGHFVPVFTGIALPLSTVPCEPKGKSDRADLIDYLASGPLAQSGIELGDTMGDLPEKVAVQYESVLDLLESSKMLEGGREAIIRWAEEKSVRWTASVFDSRYAEGAFADKVAVLIGDFWFVLTSFKRDGSFARLLVVPHRPEKQRFEKKTPGGGS